MTATLSGTFLRRQSQHFSLETDRRLAGRQKPGFYLARVCRIAAFVWRLCKFVSISLQAALEMIESIRAKFKSGGLDGLLLSIKRKLLPRRMACYESCEPLFEEKRGLELGGPSAIFARRGLFPIYQVAACIDNCNFNNKTTWEGQIVPGKTYYYDKKRPAGYQYIAEASKLACAEAASYDFILSSHMLEHSANPLLVLSECIRVLKQCGALLLVVPHKDGTFDHCRPTTSMNHLLEDFQQCMAEDDLTHLPEIMEFHDLDRDPGGGGLEAFRSRSEKNFQNRCLHHHVFDTRLAVQMIDSMRLQIQAVEPIRPYHIVLVATKPDSGRQPDNQHFLTPDANYIKSSPFPSDSLL